VLTALVLGTAGIVYLLYARHNQLSADNPTRASVGSCLTGSVDHLDPANVRIVSCGSADATFRVVQRVDGLVKEQANAACTDPGTQYVFWAGENGANGIVLCLATAR
jgi:hypothetical protein